MTEPRILLFDIESSPNLGYVWGKWEQNVISFECEWIVLSLAWKWAGEKKVHVKGLCDYPLYEEDRENDIELARLAHDLFTEADIVIGHNSVAFDTKKVQARMLFHGMDPPAPYKEVDTLKIARRHFAFTSNKLDDLCQKLDIGKKAPTGGFETWLGCLQGDEKAWAKMKKYNAHDVVLLEELYLRLRPWDKQPNLAMLGDFPDGCPKCGVVGEMQARGWTVAQTTKRQRFQCRSCGGWCSGRAITKTDVEFVP